MTNQTNDRSRYQEPAFFSYGFRPFFLSAALFAGLAVPAWIVILMGVHDPELLSAVRDWHVHEMVFGFLPAVITGFLLTAIPNWTDRTPIRGGELLSLWVLWLAGRVVMAVPFLSPLLSVIIDGAFLVVVAGLAWREISAGKSGDRNGMAITTRPANHKAHNDNSSLPLIGIRSVQLGMAVSKNPVITAGRKPKTISCTCQSRTAERSSGSWTPIRMTIHAGTASPANSAALKKNGLNPYEKNAGP